MITKVKGIVISSQIDYDEYDKICTIFSDQYGKIGFYARGVNRVISKNKYSLNLFSYGEYELFLSHTDRLSKLKTGQLITSCFDLTSNYEDYLWAQWCCDIVCNVFASYVKHYYAFVLLRSTLMALMVKEQFISALAFFLFKSLNWSGVQWKLNRCARCNQQKRIKTFDASAVGFICTDCFVDCDKLYDLDFMKILLYFDQNKAIDYREYNRKSDGHLLLLIKIIMEYYDNVVGLTTPCYYEIKKKSLILNS